MNISIEKANERYSELKKIADALLPQLKAFHKLYEKLENEIEDVVEKYERLADQADRKGDGWQAKQYEKVVDKLYAIGDKNDDLAQKVFDFI